MDFLGIVMLSVGIFVSCSSGAPANERLQKGPVITAMTKRSTADNTVTYDLEVKEEGQDFKEKVAIDEVKQIETFHADAHGESPKVDIILDFKQGRAMYRFPEKKYCLLGPLDPNQKSPNDLKESLENEQKNPKPEAASTEFTKWHIVGEIEDRSSFSTEMDNLCDRTYTIYKIAPDLVEETVRKENCRCLVYIWVCIPFLACAEVKVLC